MKIQRKKIRLDPEEVGPPVDIEHCSVCKKKISLEEAFKHDDKVVCRDCIKKMLSGFLSY